MTTHIKFLLILLSALLLTTVPCAGAEEKTDPAEKKNSQPIALSEEMEDVMIREATKVKAEFQEQVRSLFNRSPLGWDLKTIEYLSDLTLSLPGKIPVVSRFVITQSRILGVIGSMLVFLFVAALLYSLFGQRRVMARVEKSVEPLSEFIPETTYPFVLSGIKVVVSALIPLLLLGTFVLINVLIDYAAVWFQLMGRLLGLWAVGALLLRLLKEWLTRDLFKVTMEYGRTIYRWARLALLYAVFGMAAYWTADVFEIREDVLALLRFAIWVTIVVVLLILHLHKKAFISFLPDLPVRSYKHFTRFLERYYFPLLLVSFLAALSWAFGYDALGRLVLTKIWFTAAAFVLIMLLYHRLDHMLGTWFQGLARSDENARMFVSTLRSITRYTTVAATLIIIMNMLGVLNPLQRLMSFPIFRLGDTTVTFWLVVVTILILLMIFYVSRLAQSYFDYKVYPSFGIDPGLGFALNTVFKYLFFGIGVLIVLNILGINLQFLLIFAGTIGIGIGFGLQNMAANVISGFIIIFGGKIRKGDWVEVGSVLGEVTDIYLRATKVRTRDNIEYLVPNSDIISNTMVNYSLSSPLVRMGMPVGVSYRADPRQVEKIILAVAEKEPLVDKTQSPAVRFTDYGDSSINFELLFWINVRKTPRRLVRSQLYFAIFEALAEAGIEIPFPQRDIHIRSQVDRS
jgi:small-conductance mechanosensitive channel